MNITGFRNLIETALVRLDIPAEPAALYDPVRYILALGGKRLRPSLALMACQMAGGRNEDVLGPALGIEVFHNFTLLHDDIMDHAPVRRNQPTVHMRWNTNIAILSGDVMYTLACRLMNNVPDHLLRPVLDVFHRNAAAVCEGQQLDMNFEQQEDVSMEQYLEMIRLKTAVLLGASLQIGAICGGAGADAADLLYRAGCFAGIAFQLQDDLLDVFGDPTEVGKRPGGDIVSNKKTVLKIKALEKAAIPEKNRLKELYTIFPEDPAEKITEVTAIFESLGVREETERIAANYLEKSSELINTLPFEAEAKASLIQLLHQLQKRTN